MIVDAERDVVAIRFDVDGRVAHVPVAASRDGLEDLLGGPVTFRPTTSRLALVTAVEQRGPRNRLAETVQGIYGLAGHVRGALVLVGFDGDELHDGPGAARRILLGS